MVGPLRSVLGDAPAELAEDQYKDPVRQPRLVQVIEKRSERGREILQQWGVLGDVVAVGVIPVLLEVVNSRAQAGLDQP